MSCCIIRNRAEGLRYDLRELKRIFIHTIVRYMYTARKFKKVIHQLSDKKI